MTKQLTRVDLSSTIERAKPPSKEDALTARLKSLRSQTSESVVSATSPPEAHDAHQGNGHAGTTRSRSTGETHSTQSSQRDKSSAIIQGNDDIDPLLYTDDETLEELLEELRSDETWLDDVAAEEEEHQRLTTILTELSVSSGIKVDQVHTRASQDTQEAGEGSNDARSDEHDSSDGEEEVERVIREVELESSRKESSLPSSPTAQPAHPSPSTYESAKPNTQNETNQELEDTQKPPNDDPFNFPTVPSELQDQPDLLGSSAETPSDVDFAASIASRMAAMKLSGPRALPSVPDDSVDSLGLPLAPTFSPADRPVPGLVRRNGLTDEDQKTWCVVCLDDGAVYCLGCEADDDVYCARCWKEMHVGPRAGYEERGHSWETFVSRPR